MNTLFEFGISTAGVSPTGDNKSHLTNLKWAQFHSQLKQKSVLQSRSFLTLTEFSAN